MKFDTKLSESTFLPSIIETEDERNGDHPNLSSSRTWLVKSQVKSHLKNNKNTHRVNFNFPHLQDIYSYDDGNSDLSEIISNMTMSTLTTSLESFNSTLAIFEFNQDHHLVLQGRIGQGFYGEVYRGMLEYVGSEDKEPQMVAVKKLKPNAVGSCQQDFEREINIMKVRG